MVADVARPIRWQTATVLAITPETARAKTFRLRLDQPARHRAGQHFVVRLTAPDGYTAQRSYSVASAPDESGEIDLTVELLEGGEVSGYLHSEVRVADELEVRGPIGEWFVWDGGSRAVLVGGGSGVVPLMAMLRFARASGQSELVRLLVSVRSPNDLYYRSEIVGPETTLIYTRQAPAGESRPPGRLVSADLSPLADTDTTFYVCGSAGFAEAATQLLVDNGIAAEAIRVERFGPTG